MSKVCTGCGEVKSLPDFPKDKRRKDGHRAKCKECTRAQLREAYAADPAKQKERVRERYWSAPEEHRERKRTAYARTARIRASQRRYYWRNRDARIAQSAAWRAANPDHVKAYSAMDAQRRKEYHREWRRANPERIRAYRAAQPTRNPNDFLAEWRRTRPVRPHETAQESPVQAC